MLFHPANVPLKVSLILFKVHLACCEMLLKTTCSINLFKHFWIGTTANNNSISEAKASGVFLSAANLGSSKSLACVRRINFLNRSCSWILTSLLFSRLWIEAAVFNDLPSAAKASGVFLSMDSRHNAGSWKSLAHVRRIFSIVATLEHWPHYCFQNFE